jgi:hypothetical protein
MTEHIAGSAALELAGRMFPTTVPCLSVAARLGVADALAAGPLPVEELAGRVGAHARSLAKVLRILADEGIFTEVAPDVFANSRLSEPLRAGAPVPLHAMAEMIGQSWLWSCWGRLDHSVSTGKPAFDEVFGASAWHWFGAHPDSAAQFNRAMTEFTDALGEALIRAYPDYAGARRIADLGGGQGSYLAAILRGYPSVGRGLLVDLPPVVAQARARTDLAELVAAGRYEYAPGDFFVSVPSDVDIYVTKQVAHSWDDERLALLLRRCREASPRARVVLTELVASPETTRFGRDFDLTMLVTMPGDVRSIVEFAAVFDTAGYRLARTVQTGTVFSLLEAVPAGS